MTNQSTLTCTVPTQFSTNLDQVVLSPLEYLTCYEIGGDDAEAFLQGQLTNDIAQVSAERGQLTSYCTPKGRMLAIFQLCQWQKKYIAILRKDIAESVMQRLKMFVLRSKVEIKPRTTIDSIIGLCGSDTESVLSSLKLQHPNEDYETSSSEHALCVKIPGVVPRYLLLGDKSITLKVNDLDKNKLHIFSDNYWQWLDIMSGIPVVTKTTQETFVPQMTNMELIDGVSFSKGCYPGQEVVARLHYLGNASRRMYRFETQSEEELQPGENVYRTDLDNDQSIGSVVSAIKQNDDTIAGLAVLRIEAAQQNQLAIGSPSGMVANLKPLPYEIPTEKNS